MPSSIKIFLRINVLNVCFALPFCKKPVRFRSMRIIIKFPDRETEQRALGKLIPRFSGKSWASGEVAVPSAALAYLAEEGVSFTVIGPAPYERLAPLRDSRTPVV